MRTLTFATALAVSAVSAQAASPFDGHWVDDLQTQMGQAGYDDYLVANGYYTCKSCSPPRHYPADGKMRRVPGDVSVISEGVTITGPRTMVTLHSIKDIRDNLKRIDLSQLSAGLESLVYFLVIVSDELGVPIKSHRSCSRKERAEFVNVEIAHDAWVKANDLTRRGVLLDGLVRAIEGTKESRLSADVKAKLIRKITSN